MHWVPLSTVTVLSSGFEDSHVLLESSYPDGLNDVPSCPNHMKYYATSYAKPQLDNPHSAVSTVFKVSEPLQLCGIKVRGENYANMAHMPKSLKLHCTNDTECGSKDSEGVWWTEVASFEAKTERGWQMFVSEDVRVEDAQKLCDGARDTTNSSMKATGWNVDETHMAGEHGSIFKLHNSVNCTLVPWTQTEAASLYRLDVVSHNGSYIALAEVNFLAVRYLIVQLVPVVSEMNAFIECRDLSGEIRATLKADPDTPLISFREMLDHELLVPHQAILPDGRMLSKLEEDDWTSISLSFATTEA